LPLIAGLVALVVVAGGAWFLVQRGSAGGASPAGAPDGTAGASAGMATAAEQGAASADGASGSNTGAGAAQSLSIGGGKLRVLVPFDGQAGQRISLLFTSVERGVYASLERPGGERLGERSFQYPKEGFIDTITLPEAGRYNIVVEPESPTAPASTFKLRRYDVPADPAVAVEPGGAPVTIATTTPGQNADVKFDGKAGERISLRFTKVTVGSQATILKPDGDPLQQGSYVYAGDDYIDTLTLPEAGHYTLHIDPNQKETGVMTLRIYDVPADVQATLVAGGEPQTITTTTPGQNAVLAFDGKAGQRISARFTAMSIGAYASVARPNGSVQGGKPFMYPKDAFFGPVTLEATGRHQLLIDPNGPETGSMTVKLFDVPPDIVAQLKPDGTPFALRLGTPGQGARLRFSGTAGAVMLLKGTAMSIGANVALLGSDDGEVQGARWIYPKEGSLEFTPLPAAGTYQLRITPNGPETGELTLSLRTAR
jgi:hypothetical protein